MKPRARRSNHLSKVGRAQDRFRDLWAAGARDRDAMVDLVALSVENVSKRSLGNIWDGLFKITEPN